MHARTPTHAHTVEGSATVKERKKGKEEYLYSAFLAKVVHSKRSGMDHTVLLANNTMPATEAADIQLQLATHLSTLKG